MSLREPQRISLPRLHAIAEPVDFKTATLDAVAEAAVARCGIEKIEFEVCTTSDPENVLVEG